MPERIIYTHKFDALGRAETRPAHTPSEELGGTTKPYEGRYVNLEIKNPEIAEVAAYAAKPFMDIAAEIYENTKVAIEREHSTALDVDDKESIMNQSGLKELVALGERHARKAEQAARMGSFQPRVVTESEAQFLDAMKVVADYSRAQAQTNVDAFYADDDPNVIDKIVSSMGGVFSTGRKTILASKLTHMKHDTDQYHEESHLLDTSDYALEDAGKAALANKSLTVNEKLKLSNRLQALKGHTTVLGLIGQNYSYDSTAEPSTNSERESVPTRNENIAKDALEARQMLAHSPDLMKQLINETDAFKNYSIKINAKGDNPEQFDRQARILDQEIGSFKEVLSDWALNAPTESLEEYIENAQDTTTDKSESIKLASYFQIKNNYFFRDRQTALLKRMNASRTGNGSTVRSLGFEDTYFE